MSLRALSACSVLTWFVMVATPVAAQEPPSAALLQTTRSRGVEEGTAGAFDRMIRQRLDALDAVRVGGSVALDLAQLQLALGCMGETVQCMEAVSNEVGAPIVLAPALDRAGNELVATILLFDTRDGAQRRAVRQASGAGAPTEILEGVDGMLRELFGLPPAQETAGEDGEMGGEGAGAGAGAGGAGAGAGGAGAGEQPGIGAETGASLSPFPFVLIGVGAAALIAGAIVGAMSQSSADEYRTTLAGSPEQVPAVRAILSRAENEALAANVLFIAGGALAAGGLIWLLAAGNDDGSSPLVAAPMVGPDGVGIAIAGTFGGSL